MKLEIIDRMKNEEYNNQKALNVRRLNISIYIEISEFLGIKNY